MLVLILVLGWVAYPMFASAVSERDSIKAKECVILIHGMGRTAWSMKPLEFYFRRRGFQVVNFYYHSRNTTIENLADDYLGKIIETNCYSATKVHFVTHSLGGIIVRQYLATHLLPNLGRVVMIAPPNHGSAIIDRLTATKFGQWLLGKSATELGTDSHSLPNRLQAVDFDCGIIAGNRAANPLLSHLLNGPNDGKVTVESAKVSGMSDFIQLHATHTGIIWRKDVMKLCRVFITSGRFTGKPI